MKVLLNSQCTTPGRCQNLISRVRLVSISFDDGFQKTLPLFPWSSYHSANQFPTLTISLAKVRPLWLVNRMVDRAHLVWNQLSTQTSYSRTGDRRFLSIIHVPTIREIDLGILHWWSSQCPCLVSMNGLVSPRWLSSKISLRFRFKANYNETEYEAVINGLKLAKLCNVKKIIVYWDSQFVINQITNEYQVKGESMVQYATTARALA